MYCTKQNMIDRYGNEELIQLTDRDNLGVIDDTVLGQAQADADAEIDGYLASRYTLPLPDVPTSLVRVACEISRYHLYDDTAPAGVKDRYDNSVRFLRLVSKGDIRLLQDTGVTEETAGAAEVVPGRNVFDGGGF